MSEPIKIKDLGIFKYFTRENGEEIERTGTGSLALMCGDVQLYLWSIRPRKTWWGTTCNHEDGVVVSPAYIMMTNVERNYKYDFCMDIFTGYDLLISMGVSTKEYVAMAKAQGWTILEDYIKERKK